VLRILESSQGDTRSPDLASLHVERLAEVFDNESRLARLVRMRLKELSWAFSRWHWIARYPSIQRTIGLARTPGMGLADDREPRRKAREIAAHGLGSTMISADPMANPLEVGEKSLFSSGF
jgi:hypothetical protein